MDTQVTAILQKVAEYTGSAQTLIDKQNEANEQFLKKARQVAGVLANKGIIAYDKVDGFVDKIAENECEVWDLVEKLADAIPTDTLGGPADPKLASAGKDLDAFERLALYGDHRAITKSSGMIDE